MISRFVTRRQRAGEYCVWDNDAGAVAQRHENLGFDQAIDAARELNRQRSRAVPQQVAQQQQQPQPKKE